MRMVGCSDVDLLLHAHDMLHVIATRHDAGQHVGAMRMLASWMAAYVTIWMIEVVVHGIAVSRAALHLTFALWKSRAR